MDFNEIRRLVRLLERSQIHEIEIIDKGRKIRLAKAAPGNGHSGVVLSSPVFSQAATPALTAAPASAAAPVPETALTHNVRQVKSPMVGTFYTAPSPDAESYVQIGEFVHKGQVLCIVEAMKLMNEIESDFSGRIVGIHVENVQPVEFDQLLFTIEVSQERA
ncbi:MAG: acetyl-CoA carboxylase biotin carboxyl carrier protein [bacterium]